jgi:hypothetical protein
VFRLSTIKHIALSAVILYTLLGTSILHAQVLNDPMRPPGQREAGGAAPVESRYRLDSIIIAPDRRRAIINGRQLSLGDWIGHARLVDIRATEVTLWIAGQSHVLTLLPLSIKKPSSEAMRQ